MARLNWKETTASGETAEDLLESFYFQGYTDERGAQLLSVILGKKVSKAAYKCKRQNMGFGKTLGGAPLVPASQMPRFDDPPRVDGDTLVMADLHVPFHDSQFCNRVIDLALLWEVPSLVLAGDVVDLAALSPFAPEFDGLEISLEEELKTARKVFDALAGFERVLWLAGNHEIRILRQLKASVKMSRLAGMFTELPQLETTPYHWCAVGNDWHVTHPGSRSVIPARVPFFLIRQQRKNVAAGHDHRWGIVQDESGLNVAVSIGVCADPARLGYDALRDTTHPAVIQGALIVKRGYPWLLSPKWTDWRALRSIKW